jgi:hypothetical protein
MLETDIKKYPWLESFLVSDLNNFEGIHNIELGAMQFSYTFSMCNKDSILNKIDNIAQSESWSLVNSSAKGREYSKALNEFPAEAGQTIIKIEVDTIESRIHFSIK